MFLNSEVWNTIYKVSISYTSHPSSNAWREAVTHEAGHSGINHACNEAPIAFAMRLVQMPDHSLDALYVEPPTSHLAMSLGLKFMRQQKGRDRGRWVGAPKYANSMAASELDFWMHTCAIIPILSANVCVQMRLRNRLSLQYCFSECCIN